MGCISSLLRTNGRNLKYESVGCQQQLFNDCGLHKIENAITLALDKDLSQSFYNWGVMRQNLTKFMFRKVISAFPKTNSKEENNVSVSNKI